MSTKMDISIKELENIGINISNLSNEELHLIRVENMRKQDWIMFNNLTHKQRINVNSIIRKVLQNR